MNIRKSGRKSGHKQGLTIFFFFLKKGCLRAQKPQLKQPKAGKQKNKNVEAREGWLDLDNPCSETCACCSWWWGEDLPMHARDSTLRYLVLIADPTDFISPSHGYAHRHSHPLSILCRPMEAPKPESPTTLLTLQSKYWPFNINQINPVV